MGIKKYGYGIGSSQNNMLQYGCGKEQSLGLGLCLEQGQDWSERKLGLFRGHQKLTQRSPLLINHNFFLNRKIVKCGCDLDNIIGGSGQEYSQKHEEKQNDGVTVLHKLCDYRSVYTSTKNDYLGLNELN